VTTIIAGLASVWAIAGLAWAARKRLPFSVCPVCLGVGGTWLWMVAARFGGLAVDPAMLAVLLGGSAVGIAQALERRLPPGRSPMLWKALFVPAGFVAAYGLAVPHWLALAAGLAALALLALAFLAPRRDAGADSAAVESIEEQMKRCC
jgi:hypothetical protein